MVCYYKEVFGLGMFVAFVIFAVFILFRDVIERWLGRFIRFWEVR